MSNLSIEGAKGVLAALPPAQISNAKLLRLPAVSARVGMQRTTIYDLVKGGKFPQPVKIGRASAWVDLEVTAWMADRMAAR